MKLQILDSLNPISIISFLSVFALSRDSNGAHKGAPLRLLELFMKSITDGCNDRIAVRSILHKRQKERIA